MPLQLARRERRTVLGGAVVLAIVIAYLFAVQPLLDRNRDLDRLVAQKERDYVEILQVGETYREARVRLEAIEAKLGRAGRGFQLLSFLEGLASRNGVRDRIAYMRPQPSAEIGRFLEQTVELRLDRVTINQLVKLLVQIAEAPQGLRVKRLSVVTRYDNASQLDVVVQVAAYQLA